MPGERPRSLVLVIDGGAEVTLWRGEAPPHADLPLVEDLLRLQLAARRRGWRVRLDNPCPQLLELLDLVGLADLLVEVGREAVRD